MTASNPAALQSNTRPPPPLEPAGLGAGDGTGGIGLAASGVDSGTGEGGPEIDTGVDGVETLSGGVSRSAAATPPSGVIECDEVPDNISVARRFSSPRCMVVW